MTEKWGVAVGGYAFLNEFYETICSAGIPVHQADNAEEAKVLLKQAKAKPAFIVLDDVAEASDLDHLQMTSRQFASIYAADHRIIMLTERVRNVGNVRVVRKSDLNGLARALRTAIEESP